MSGPDAATALAAAPIWGELVGQEHVVATLRAAVEARSPGAMTHAWLFTGPPGSGRSNAALAFAAALQCESGGCGQCRSCVTAAAGSHPDIAVVSTDGLSIGVGTAREIVRKAALSPALGRWQVVVIEDADRLTDQAANALLKAIEEPTPHTVWMLCAPASQDVIMTIRSRCRSVLLRTPPTHAIAELLQARDGIAPDVAQSVAAASLGHIGRARALARNPELRERRAAVLAMPSRIRHIGDAFAEAKGIVTEADSRADAQCDESDARELADLQAVFGVEDRGRRPAGYSGALASLTKDQKARRKRLARDAIDGVLLDLISFLRDVLARQVAPGVRVVNADVENQIDSVASRWSTSHTWVALDAVTTCRSSLTANAAPTVALENMLVRFLP
jgi:DNA polymerase-3 subunit delta'